MLVDLARVSVLLEKSSENSHSPHPLNLGGESSVGRTLSLTGSGVSSLSLGSKEITGSGSGVDNGGLDNAVEKQRGGRSAVRSGKRRL